MVYAPKLGTPNLVTDWALGINGLKARDSRACGSGRLGARVAEAHGAWCGEPWGPGVPGQADQEASENGRPWSWNLRGQGAGQPGGRGRGHVGAGGAGALG